MKECRNNSANARKAKVSRGKGLEDHEIVFKLMKFGAETVGEAYTCVLRPLVLHLRFSEQVVVDCFCTLYIAAVALSVEDQLEFRNTTLQSSGPHLAAFWQLSAVEP